MSIQTNSTENLRGIHFSSPLPKELMMLEIFLMERGLFYFPEVCK